MRMIYDADQLADSLFEMFREYAKNEEERGNFFNADIWHRAADYSRAHVGKWIPSKTDKPVDTWKEIDVSDI